MIMSSDSAKQLILGLLEKNYQKIFTVVHGTKDGRLRIMNCRLLVKKFLSGGKLKYSPRDLDQIIVCDMAIVNRNKRKEKSESPYRSIRINTIQSIRMENEIYTID